jgi:RNA 3'-terminal phosphate cyclase (ATP)
LTAIVQQRSGKRDLADVLILDGSYGEGGGQILRTALSLSMVTTRAFRLVNIRAGRRNPGLLPQHLSAVRAAAAISGASVSGDRLASGELSFAPSHSPRGGAYVFDVVQAAERGSAGSVTLILQTLVVSLALAEAASNVVVRGGTHVEWSPPFDDFANAYLPACRTMGFRVDAELKRWGWYPVDGGEVACTIAGRSPSDDRRGAWPRPLRALERGLLQRIRGRSVAANLPAHIPQRMADRARASLADLGVPVDIEPQRLTAACPGAGIFLIADYEPLAASFSAYGRLGRPCEAVPSRRPAPCASTTYRRPPWSSISPTSCYCRCRSLAAPPNSRCHARPDT